MSARIPYPERPLTRREGDLLAAIDAAGCPSTQAELAAKMGVTSGYIGNLIFALIRKGFLSPRNGKWRVTNIIKRHDGDRVLENGVWREGASATSIQGGGLDPVIPSITVTLEMNACTVRVRVTPEDATPGEEVGDGYTGEAIARALRAFDDNVANVYAVLAWAVTEYAMMYSGSDNPLTPLEAALVTAGHTYLDGWDKAIYPHLGEQTGGETNAVGEQEG